MSIEAHRASEKGAEALLEHPEATETLRAAVGAEHIRQLQDLLEDAEVFAMDEYVVDGVLTVQSGIDYLGGTDAYRRIRTRFFSLAEAMTTHFGTHLDAGDRKGLARLFDAADGLRALSIHVPSIRNELLLQFIDILLDRLILHVVQAVRTDDRAHGAVAQLESQLGRSAQTNDRSRRDLATMETLMPALDLIERALEQGGEAEPDPERASRFEEIRALADLAPGADAGARVDGREATFRFGRRDDAMLGTAVVRLIPDDPSSDLRFRLDATGSFLLADTNIPAGAVLPEAFDAELHSVLFRSMRTVLEAHWRMIEPGEMPIDAMLRGEEQAIAETRGAFGDLTDEGVPRDGIHLRGLKTKRVKQALERLLGAPVRSKGSHLIFRGRTGKVAPLPFHRDEPIGAKFLKKCLATWGISEREFVEAMG